MATLIRTTPFRGGGGGGGVRPNNEKNRNCHPATGLVLSLKSTSVAGGTLGSSTSSSVNLVVDSQRRSRFLPGITASAISNSSSSSGSVSSSSPLTSSEESTTTSLLDDKIEVFDLNGRAISISDLWKDRKAVVAFARHFGCVLCRKRADYLVSVKDKMDAAGVALILIGPGSVDQAKAFYEQTKFKGEVYADPSYSSYKALNFVSGVLTTFTPKAGLKIIQLYMEGYRQDWELSFEKDTRTRGGWQQGGIIVAGPGKSNISYIHKDKEAGDDPDIEDILKACCS